MKKISLKSFKETLTRSEMKDIFGGAASQLEEDWVDDPSGGSSCASTCDPNGPNTCAHPGCPNSYCATTHCGPNNVRRSFCQW